jgi:hypothetical protein
MHCEHDRALTHGEKRKTMMQQPLAMAADPGAGFETRRDECVRVVGQAPVQTDSIGELVPTNQASSLSSDDRIPDGGGGGIFEEQAVQAKLPRANAVHQLNACKGGRRAPEAFESQHRVCSGLDVAMVLLDHIVQILI